MKASLKLSMINNKKNRVILIGFALLILIISPKILNSYLISLLTQVLIFSIFAMSLDILVGYGGIISFNHATFFGLGGYTVGILFRHNITGFWVALPAGMVITGIFAALLGLIVLRSSGPYFLILTLAFGQMFFALAWKWRNLTGGDDGLPGVARPELGLPVSMWKNENFFYLVLVFTIILLIILCRIMNSSFGKSVLGVKESESRMQALGYNTWLVKYTAYILAGTVAGLAGVLNVYYTGFISPQELNWTASGLVMLMVIIGGSGTLVGPMIGSGVILILQNIMSSYTQRWPMIMGGIFILCVMYARNGIIGLLYAMLCNGGDKNEST